MFKVDNKVALEMLNDIFKLRNRPHQLRNHNSLEPRRVCFVFNGTKTLSYLGPNICYLVPNGIKQLDSLKSFKLKNKKWIPQGCTCRLCKRHTRIYQVGFL